MDLSNVIWFRWWGSSLSSIELLTVRGSWRRPLDSALAKLHGFPGLCICQVKGLGLEIWHIKFTTWLGVFLQVHLYQNLLSGSEPVESQWVSRHISCILELWIASECSQIVYFFKRRSQNLQRVFILVTFIQATSIYSGAFECRDSAQDSNWLWAGHRLAQGFLLVCAHQEGIISFWNKVPYILLSGYTRLKRCHRWTDRMHDFFCLEPTTLQYPERSFTRPAWKQDEG